MHAALKIFSGGKRGVHSRRLSAVAGIVAVIGASTMAASPAYAQDKVAQTCQSYHSWTECISYDFTNGNVAINAYNGYSSSETESLTLITNPDGGEWSEGFTIPAGNWRGFSEHVGIEPTGDNFGYIDNTLVVESSSL
jgi:hypothetical protein